MTFGKIFRKKIILDFRMKKGITNIIAKNKKLRMGNSIDKTIDKGLKGRRKVRVIVY